VLPILLPTRKSVRFFNSNIVLSTPQVLKNSNANCVSSAQRVALANDIMTSKIESLQTSDSVAKDIPTQSEGYRCSNKNTSAPKVSQKSIANCDSSPTSEFYNQQITDTFNRLKEIFPAEATEEHRNQLWNIADTAYRLADEVFSVKEANIWAADFRITDDIVNSDEALFRASMRNLTTMVLRRKKALAPHRLNPHRVQNFTRSDNPERAKLFKLAQTGMPLLLRPGFIPNGSGSHPPLRRKYVTVQCAVNKLLFDNFHQKGLAFVLTKATAQTIPGLHLSPLSWTEKQGKVQGRPIGDCSDGGREQGNEPLNSDHTKTASDDLWGQIRHPTLKDICLLITDFIIAETAADIEFNDDDIVLIKLDLQQAFTLIEFEADAVKHLAMEMSDDRVIFFICGIFGWSGTPAAFQVYTRAILHELLHKLKGKALMYVDDIIIVTRKGNVHFDIDVANTVCCNLLGNNAVEHKKTEFGRKIVAIGYEFDLDRGLVTLSPRNTHRTLYAFMSVDFDKTIKVSAMQKLASLSSRCSQINVYMKPYVKILYNEYAGRGQHTSFTISPTARHVIWFFRILLGLTAICPDRFSRSLTSFRSVTPTLVIEFDASLNGIGILYYIPGEERDTLIGSSVIDISSLGFGSEAKYQNSAEFLATILGIEGLKELSIITTSIHLRGDSITALTWASTEKFKGDLVSNAASVFILQGILTGVSVGGVTHLPAEDNWRTDFLSRGGTIEELLIKDPTLDKPKIVHIHKQKEILALCNPKRETVDEKEFRNFWVEIKETLQS
jgi:hypothetical protein